MTQVWHADTAEVGLHDRVDFWMDQWEALGGVDANTVDGEDFAARVATARLGGIRVCRIAVGQHRIERTHKRIRENDPGFLKVVFQNRGEACIEQHTQRVILRPGQWMIYDTSRPYKLQTAVPNEQLALLVPRSEIAALGASSSSFVMRPFKTARGVSQLLQRCLASTLDDLGEESSPFDEDVALSLLDIFKVALNEKISLQAHGTIRDSMSERIRTYIRRNCSNPELSVGEIAAAMKCTKRYLHKIFSDGQTISDYIWSLRVQRCASDLVQREFERRSITEIAFANGFSNSAHFSRMFKARKGMTPREYRARALSGKACN